MPISNRYTLLLALSTLASFALAGIALSNPFGTPSTPLTACSECASKHVLSAEDTDWVKAQLHAQPDHEVQAIFTWMTRSNLNRYGDPQDTVYAGGNPLFSEESGETVSLYTYLITRHPNQPWIHESPSFPKPGL